MIEGWAGEPMTQPGAAPPNSCHEILPVVPNPQAYGPGSAGILPAPCAPTPCHSLAFVTRTPSPLQDHNRHPRRSRTGRKLTSQNGDPFATTERVAPADSVGSSARKLLAVNTPLDPRVKPEDDDDRGVGR